MKKGKYEDIFFGSKNYEEIDMQLKKILAIIVLFLLVGIQLNAQKKGGPECIIVDIAKGSIAEKIGLKSGDIILSINGKEIFDKRALGEQIKSSKGSEIEIEILRKGKKMTFKSPFNADRLGIYSYFYERDRLLSPKEMKEDLNTLFSAIPEIHPNPYFNITKEEFNKLKAKAYDKIKKPMTISDFWKLASPIVASLGDGHTNLGRPVGEYLYQIYSLDKHIVFPLKLRIIKDRALVQKNFSDAPIREGDYILSINGIPTKKIINDLIPYISGDLLQFKTSIIARDFPEMLFLVYGFKGPFNVKIKDAKGKIKEYKLEGGDKNIYEKMRAYNYGDNNFHFEEMPELKAGIIRFNNFEMRDKFDKFLKNTFTKIKTKKYRYLIIDLRNNGGGDSKIAEYLLNYITDKPYRYFGELQSKVSKYTLKYVKEDSPNEEFKIDSIYTYKDTAKSPPKNPLRFKGKVFVLISNFTFSEASNFAEVVKYFKIGTLVGEESGDPPAHYGGVCPVNLPNSHLNLDVSWQYVVDANGDTTYVHHGVMPDIYIKTDAKDIRKGNDPVIEKVKEIIRKNLRRNK